MESQDSPTVIPCSEELETSEASMMESSEVSEVNPMSSTRIGEDNSVSSMINEGFMIDSASLSLTAVEEDSRLDSNKTGTESEINETGDEVIGEAESTEAEVAPEDEIVEDEMEDETVEDESVEVQSPSSRRRKGTVDGTDEEDEEEDTEEYPTPQFPLARVKKIMAICAGAEDEDVSHDTSKTSKEKGKGNVLITKEAIYLTTLATEHFVSVIGKMAGNVTTSSKKKTLTLEHLKRALSDTDAFAFLEGCFQPSLIIGD